MLFRLTGTGASPQPKQCPRTIPNPPPPTLVLYCPSTTKEKDKASYFSSEAILSFQSFAKMAKTAVRIVVWMDFLLEQILHAPSTSTRLFEERQSTCCATQQRAIKPIIASHYILVVFVSGDVWGCFSTGDATSYSLQLSVLKMLSCDPDFFVLILFLLYLFLRAHFGMLTCFFFYCSWVTMLPWILFFDLVL